MKRVKASNILSCFVCIWAINKGEVCYEDGTRHIHKGCVEKYKIKQEGERK